MTGEGFTTNRKLDFLDKICLEMEDEFLVSDFVKTHYHILQIK